MVSSELMKPSLPDVVTSQRLRLPLVTPEDAAGMIAGRRRQSWHRDGSLVKPFCAKNSCSPVVKTNAWPQSRQVRALSA